MADTQQVQLLLNDLGKIVGIPDLALRDGQCALLIDDRLELEISHADGDDRLVLAALLGKMPADAGPERYLDLLDANFFWRGTEGATLGIDRDSDSVVLVDSIHVANLHAGDLEAKLGRFVRAAQDWTARIAGEGPVTGGTTSGDKGNKDDLILRA